MSVLTLACQTCNWFSEVQITNNWSWMKISPEKRFWQNGNFLEVWFFFKTWNTERKQWKKMKTNHIHPKLLQQKHNFLFPLKPSAEANGRYRCSLSLKIRHPKRIHSQLDNTLEVLILSFSQASLGSASVQSTAALLLSLCLKPEFASLCKLS